LPEIPKRDLPEIWLMVVVRLVITLVFGAAVVFDDLRDQMQLVVPVVIAGLIAVILQSDRPQTQMLRKQSILDLTVLVTVVPIAVLNGFVAAEPGTLLPAERSALFQTAGGLIIAIALMIWLGTMLFPGDRALLPALLLPGLVIIVAVSFVFHDYRNQSVLAMLAASYLIGAAAIALGALVDEPVRRYVPAVFFGSMIFAGLILFDPGLGSVFERDSLVQVFTGFMLLIGIVALVFIQNPSLNILTSGNRSARSRASRPGRQWRSDSDSSRDA
jgi:hypothetical protein